MELSFRLLLLTNLLFIYGAAGLNYIVLVPKKVEVGKQCDVLIQMLEGFPDQSRFTVSLDKTTPLVQTAQTAPGSDKEVLIRLPIPSALAPRTYDLVVEATNDATQNNLFRNSTTITVASVSEAILIQTDKGIYKPSQTIKMRIVVLDADLKVTKPEMDVTISEAKGNKLKQWKKVKSDSGVISEEFEIADQPPLGNWTITAKIKDGEEESVKVLVDEYVLPKFDVNVKIPPAIHSGMDTFTAEVKATYTYGKGVNGKGYIICEKQRRDFNVVDGKASVPFTIRDLSLNSGSAVTCKAFVKDPTAELEGDAVTKYYASEYKITCLDSSDQIIYPGIPYKYAFKVADHGGRPITSVKQLTVISTFGKTTDKTPVTIPENGIVMGTTDVPLKFDSFSISGEIPSTSVNCNPKKYKSASNGALKIEVVISAS